MAAARSTAGIQRRGPADQVGGRLARTVQGVRTMPAERMAPMTILGGAANRPAKRGQRARSGATRRSWPLNMTPTPRMRPAVSHQSREARRAARKKGTRAQASHWGQMWVSMRTAGLNHIRNAAVMPAAQPRCSGGRNDMEPDMRRKRTAMPSHWGQESQTEPYQWVGG